MSKNPNSQTQTDLELIYSKYQLLPVLREEFSTVDKNPFIVDLLVQIYLHRQADVITLVGLLSPKYGNPQEVADQLLEAVKDDFLDYDDNQEKFIVRYDVSQDVQDMLERYQYPLPMVVKPDLVLNNTDTGYKTIKGLAILNGSSYFMDKDICLDHLNRANSVALSLNFDVIKSAEATYSTPKRKIDEGFQDYTRRVRQSDTFYGTSIEVMEGISSLSDVLYLTHKYDRRGRCYASGYHINTQGTDYHKAVLEFAEKEIVKES